MKKILPIAFLVSIYACDEVLIEENRRIEVKGSLISLENEPISEIHVLSAGTNNRQLSSNTDKILGRGISSENGVFDFISLDSYSHDLLLAVNPTEIDHNASYSSTYFYDPSGGHSKLYDFEEFTIARKIEFQLNITNTSQTQDSLRYAIEYQRPVRNFIYVNGNFVEQQDSGNFISIREHRPDSDPLNLTLSILEETELIFSYNIGENPFQEISIPVSVENNSYDFEY